jgi:hypothetical protein
MWPSGDDNAGCLETVLWQIIKPRYPEKAKCVEEALRCAGVNRHWSKSKLDKARVRCFIAVEIERNPAVALSLLWRDFPDIIPIRSRPLRRFVQFLRSI